MTRKKGSKVIDGKVIAPDNEVYESAVKARPKVIEALAEKAPVEEPPKIEISEANVAPQSNKEYGVKFLHEGEELHIILWKGNQNADVRVPAFEIINLPRGRLAERVATRLIEAINQM